MYEQREIVLLPFPYSDLTGAKQRPALIISNKKFNKTSDRICCLITSNKIKDGILANKFEEGKLPFKSWIKPCRIFTIDERAIKRKLCKIDKNLFSKVIDKFNEYLEQVY